MGGETRTSILTFGGWRGVNVFAGIGVDPLDEAFDGQAWDVFGDILEDDR